MWGDIEIAVFAWIEAATRYIEREVTQELTLDLDFQVNVVEKETVEERFEYILFVGVGCINLGSVGIVRL